MTVNHDVTGSSPVWGAIFFAYFYHGGIPERPKGTDCKSVGTAFEGSNPSPSILYIRQSVDNLQAGFFVFKIGIYHDIFLRDGIYCYWCFTKFYK